MKTLNKKELAARISFRAGVNAGLTDEILTAFAEEVKSAVADGYHVTLSRFGVFESRDRAARPARNPNTGEPVPVPARTVPVFRAARSFRERVNAKTRNSTTEEG